MEREVTRLKRRYLDPAISLAGRDLRWGERTFIMGIVNATPDSFSGDGVLGHPEQAARLAKEFEAAGADIVDLEGESSRPGASPLGPDEEIARMLPALRAIRAATPLPVSIDTYHAVVARAAIAEGAAMVNDINGLRGDAGMAAVVAEAGVPLVAMHNQRGRKFHDVIGDIRAGFEATLCIAAAAGIDRRRLILDPGFGFGWTHRHNLEMIRRLPELWDVKMPLLIGPSRKSTLGDLVGLPVDQRVEATGAAVALAIAGGIDIVRVHDVREIARVVRVADAIVRSEAGGA